MALCRLNIDGKCAWELEHHLPVLWPWLFDPKAITESRRLHATVFDAADRLSASLGALGGLEGFGPLASAFGDFRPDYLPRALGVAPDAIVSLDLLEVERRRPYNHEKASALWEAFFSACREGNARRAMDLWGDAMLSPLRFTMGRQRDALHLAARAEELGLETTGLGRATALGWLLLGQPVSRPAKALTHVVVEELQKFGPVAFIPKKSPFRGALRRLMGG